MADQHNRPNPTPGQLDARLILDKYLQGLGINLPRNWVWHEITSSGLTDATAIVDKIELDIQNTTAFKVAFWGNEMRKKAGLPVLSVQDYLSYVNQAHELARAAGLPPGFMTRDEIGTLIGNDVSITELNARINQGFEAAQMAPAETRQLLHEYYGVNLGHLAAYYLDPKKAAPLLLQQLQAAQIGTQGVVSGFGDIGSAQATALAKLGITSDQARAGFANISTLKPLTEALPGQPQHGPGVIDANTLISAEFLGSGSAQMAVQRAEETRTAPFKGGGGFAGGAEGVTGLGYGQT